MPSDGIKVTDTFVGSIFDEEGTEPVAARMRPQLFVLIASEVGLHEEGNKKRDGLRVFAVQRCFDECGGRYPGCDTVCVFVRWCSLFIGMGNGRPKIG